MNKPTEKTVAVGAVPMALPTDLQRLTGPLREVHHRITTKVAVVALTAVALLALSACSTSHNTVASPSATMASPVFPAAPEALGADPRVGATCGVLSAIETNLNNALEGHKAGTLSDTSYKVIIGTVAPDLRLVGGVADYGLQADLKNLNSAIKQSPAKLAGADFDPETTTFEDAVGRLSQDCVVNQSPLTVASTTG
jgi:hypothetical protein